MTHSLHAFTTEPAVVDERNLMSANGFGACDAGNG
ncbi:hypothetical protein MT49_0898 [Mycobacterium tuberculosis 49-02]|nr:hypothetical protein Z029_04500 [Mycobacterium tuberculosis INS_SEN]CDM09063.1 hypothetical protein MT49_0898 [Mycobacterium tuberculosis 49-02]